MLNAVFLGINGHEWQLKEAMIKLEVGKSYILKAAHVHSWHTDLYLEGVQGYFNSVMFDVQDENGESANVCENGRGYFEFDVEPAHEAKGDDKG